MNILTHPGVLVFLGGGLGANLRHWLGVLFRELGWRETFPWHTLAINIVGSFALGYLVPSLRDRPAWQLLLCGGFCGGFTTFSSFSLETVELLQANRWALAAANVLGSVFAAVAGAWLGMRIADGP